MKNIVLVVWVLLLSGCGLAGGTRQFVLDYDEVSGRLASNVEVVGVRKSEDAAVNQNVMAYNWGKFSDKDLNNIYLSLKKTLEQKNLPGAGPVNMVHVFIHKYVLSFSNTRISMLVVVDWCLESDRNVIYDELFFAAFDSGPSLMGHFGTLGGEKNKTHKAIVSRIVEKTFSFLIDGYEAKNAERIYFSRDDVFKVLPKFMSGTLALPMPSATVYASGFGGTPTIFDKELEFNRIDWESYLKAGR